MTDGAIGVAGQRANALGAARSVVLQAAALHSPAELAVCSFASGSSARDWDFLKWLPHTTSPHSPIERRPPRRQRTRVLGARRRARGRPRRHGHHKDARRPAVGRPTVLVLVESDASIDRSRLVAIAERGHRAGILVVWVAETQPLLPAACQTFLVVSDDQSSLAGYVHAGE